MASSTNAVKQAALEICKKLPGSRVFPTPPMTKKAALDFRKVATNNASEIETLFGNDPELNLGLVPGDYIGVFDIEGPQKGLDRGPPGEVSFSEMIARFGELPVTLTAETPSGGKHVFFTLPYPMSFQPQACGFANIEFRTGPTCYVLASPSRTNVGEYRWVDPHAAIAHLPQAWVEALDAFKRPTKATASTQITSLDATLKAQHEARFSKTQKEPQLEPILKGCPWLRNLIENQASQSAGDWYAMLSIVARCQDGEKLAHMCSKDYPGYDHAETAEKLDRALTAAGPRTCADIKSKHCEGCIFAHHGEGWSPLALGLHYPGMIDVLSSVVYATEIEAFVTIEDRKVWRPSAFAASVQHMIKKNPREQLLMSSSLVRIEKLDYIAGDERLVVGRVGNRWMRAGVQPKAGDCKVILEFINYLLPVDEEREHILDYFAHLVQRPGVKIAHGVMLTGVQGNGKSTFARILGRLFGRNARTVDGTELTSKWKSRFVDVQLLHIEEAYSGGKLEVYDESKQLMTEETFPVEEKGVPRWDGRTPRGVIMNTNAESGVVIQQGERRWFIASTASGKADSSYFSKFHEDIADDAVIAAFGHWLERRNITTFRPKAPPPMTAAKEAAMEATATPLAQALRCLIESENAAWSTRTFVTIEQVADSLTGLRFDLGKPTHNKIAKALAEIGAVKIQRLRYRGKLLRLWAIGRDARKWEKASEDEIRRRYERDLMPPTFCENVCSIAPSLDDLTKLAVRAARVVGAAEEDDE